MHRGELASALEDTYDADPDVCRVVARTAGDLSDAGRYSEDVGEALTPDLVVDELADAPDGYDLLERWNWWVGSLSLAHGGYDRFIVRPLPEQE